MAPAVSARGGANLHHQAQVSALVLVDGGIAEIIGLGSRLIASRAISSTMSCLIPRSFDF